MEIKILFFYYCPDELKIYVSQFNTHHLLQFNTGTLTVEQALTAGPNPTRVAIGSEGDLLTVLNEADTTVSLITP